MTLKYASTTYNRAMVFKETSIFTKQINTFMDDDTYRGLQSMLIRDPSAGKVIQGSGGIRKLRWAGNTKGKRGGSRLIYYWAVNQHQIYMLYIYQKSETTDLTKVQIAQLKKVVEAEY